MLSKFSVKRPYTVWVCVAMIVILGIVSLTNMTADLIPSMNMPYSIVYTTYVGASPEEVENAVTRPVERAMATVSNIENISSVSSENLSLVILEFADDTDMDSANIEMRENLDSTSGTWSDKIGSPVIMNINPDMIPVMVAAVNVDGYEGAALKDYVDNNITSRLESVSGVASATVSGGVTESVEVTISAEKLKATNDKVKKALDDKFADAKEEISDAKSKINSAISKIEKGQNEVAKAKKQINEKQSALATQLAEAKSQADSKLTEIIETKIDLNNKLADLNTQKESLLKSREQLNDPASTAGMDADTLAVKITELDTAITQVNTAISTIETTLSQLEAGQIQAEAAKKQLEIQESTGNYQLYSALAETSSTNSTLTSTKSQLESSKKQIESSEDTLEDTIDSTYEKLDLNTLITRSLVNQILSAQNFSMPAGYIDGDDNSQMLVRIGDKLAKVEDIENLVLMDLGLDGLDPIKVSDVCDVAITDDSNEVYAKINGVDGILLTFDKQTGYSTGDVADSLKAEFEALEAEQEGLEFTVLMDQGIYIDFVVSSVFENLLWGALFAIIILIFFLKSAKPTIIIAVSIPVSLLFAISLMYFSDVTINIVSLSGLALAVGMLVDNSIVVIENIYRLRGEGVPLFKSCVKGASQVAGAIISSTITTCCVFLPIVFTTGITKQLFVDLALTVTYSLMASLLVALTVVPAMSAGLLKNVPEKKNRLIDWLQEKYAKSISFFLNHKAIVLIVSIALLVGSAYFAYKSGTSFMPTMESTQLTATITPPEGSTKEEAMELSDKVVERLLEISDIETIGAMTGGSGMTSMMSGGASSSDNSISLYIILNENMHLSNANLKEEIANKTADLDCEINVVSEMSDMSALVGTGVKVTITGEDLDKLQALAKTVGEKMEGIEGITEVDDGLSSASGEFRISVDKDKASAYNLTVAGIFQQVSAKISTATSATTIDTDTKDIDVFVNDEAAEKFTMDDIKNLEITGKDSEQKTVKLKLSEVATFTETTGLSSINRVNQTRTISVSAEVDDDYNIGNVGNEVKKAIDTIDVPSGYSVELSGQNEEIYDALEQLALMLLLAIVFVYLVMVAQFQSLKMPFIIMFTIPLAFTGGFIALIICGMDISVISMLGFVILTGVIVNNGIVLVDYINQLRIDKMPKREAIIEAGRTRLRPILMTAITTILGLLMMAFGVGMGADMVQPLAVVSIGGMTYGTLMTLWIVPVIYDIFNKKKDVFVRNIEDEDEEILEDDAENIEEATIDKIDNNEE